jgi:hypothetical protein
MSRKGTQENSKHFIGNNKCFDILEKNRTFAEIKKINVKS